MVQVFEDIHLTWGGREYVIPHQNVMMAIAKVEEIVTFPELDQYTRRGAAPTAKLSQAYGAILRHAGCNVSDDEVYLSMFEEGMTKQRIVDATSTLLLLMLPPKAVAAASGPKKKPQSTSG